MDPTSDHYCTPPKRGGTDGARWTCPKCGAHFRFKAGSRGGTLGQRLFGSWLQTKNGRTT